MNQLVSPLRQPIAHYWAFLCPRSCLRLHERSPGKIASCVYSRANSNSLGSASSTLEHTSFPAPLSISSGVSLEQVKLFVCLLLPVVGVNSVDLVLFCTLVHNVFAVVVVVFFYDEGGRALAWAVMLAVQFCCCWEILLLQQFPALKMHIIHCHSDCCTLSSGVFVKKSSF